MEEILAMKLVDLDRFEISDILRNLRRSEPDAFNTLKELIEDK